jgi:hypothetical protein
MRTMRCVRSVSSCHTCRNRCGRYRSGSRPPTTQCDASQSSIVSQEPCQLHADTTAVPVTLPAPVDPTYLLVVLECRRGLTLCRVVVVLLPRMMAPAGIIPNERKTSYDMRRIIELVVDEGSWFEIGTCRALPSSARQTRLRSLVSVPEASFLLLSAEAIVGSHLVVSQQVRSGGVR